MKDSSLGSKAIHVKLGDCPPDATSNDYSNANNKKDKKVKPCHGPIMTRGLVAWAGGTTGPDFFINAYEKPAKWWGREHTVWGEIIDTESLKLVDTIINLPVTVESHGLSFLNERLHFTLEII